MKKTLIPSIIGAVIAIAVIVLASIFFSNIIGILGCVFVIIGCGFYITDAALEKKNVINKKTGESYKWPKIVKIASLWAGILLFGLSIALIFTSLITGWLATLILVVFILGIACVTTGIVFKILNVIKDKPGKMKVYKWTFWSGVITYGAALIASIIILIVSGDFLNPSTYSPVQNYNPSSSQHEEVNDAESTSQPTNGDIFSINDPTNSDDPEIWNKPYEAGVMIDGSGNTAYVQTGKDGIGTVVGKVYDDQYFVIDSYKLSQTINGDTKEKSNGNLMVVSGPFDFDAYPIVLTDGCGQIIPKSELQDYLNETVAVKFARGNWDSEKNQWSYSPWALKNIWALPDGIKYNPIVLTYETDTYPGRDTAPDLSNTK